MPQTAQGPRPKTRAMSLSKWRVLAKFKKMSSQVKMMLVTQQRIKIRSSQVENKLQEIGRNTTRASNQSASRSSCSKPSWKESRKRSRRRLRRMSLNITLMPSKK